MILVFPLIPHFSSFFLFFSLERYVKNTIFPEVTHVNTKKNKFYNQLIYNKLCVSSSQRDPRDCHALPELATRLR